MTGKPHSKIEMAYTQPLRPLPTADSRTMSESDSDANLPITLGIEEEFFLIDPNSAICCTTPTPASSKPAPQAPARIGSWRSFSAPRSRRITVVCYSIASLREALKATRRLVIDAAEQHGAAVMAASTHPFAAWESQLPTAKQRYEDFAVTFQETVRRLVVNGHARHAGLATPTAAFRIMTAIRRYLPLLNALSGSSPFNDARESGFKCGRLNLFEAMPRTTFPAPCIAARNTTR